MGSGLLTSSKCKPVKKTIQVTQKHANDVMKPSLSNSQMPPYSSSSIFWKFKQYKYTMPQLIAANLWNKIIHINFVSHGKCFTVNLQYDCREALERNDAPDNANYNTQYLAWPINDIEKFILQKEVDHINCGVCLKKRLMAFAIIYLILPFGFANNRARPWRC